MSFDQLAMSSLMPFEGSGESIFTPLEPSTTAALYKDPTTTAAGLYKATTTNAGVTTAVAPTVLCIATSATEDHQSISTKSIQFLLPLCTWAAPLLGVVVLLSVTIIWITLVVGWKKNKRRKRRDDEMKLKPKVIFLSELKSVD